MPELHLVTLPDPARPATPRAATLAVIDLMRALISHGKPVAVLPPLERPNLAFLRACGHTGALSTVAQPLLRLAMGDDGSSETVCATVVPAADVGDGRLHLVLANHQSSPQRQLEAAARVEQLHTLFPDRQRVVVHAPLPALPLLADEGDSNHARFSTGGGRCNLMVHGRASGLAPIDLPLVHPARHSREASEAVVRLTAMPDVLHVRQHPAVIDAGITHNDGVMASSRDRILIHEHAWVGQAAILEELRHHVPGVRTAQVTAGELSLAEARSSRLFGSCLLRTPQGHVLLASSACADGRPRRIIDRLIGEGFLGAAGFLDLDQPPASLRLRIPIAAADLGLVHPGVLMDGRKLDTLAGWAEGCLREKLAEAEVADPRLHDELRRALDLLTRLLGLGAAFYPFQREAARAASDA